MTGSKLTKEAKKGLAEFTMGKFCSCHLYLGITYPWYAIQSAIICWLYYSIIELR